MTLTLETKEAVNLNQMKQLVLQTGCEPFRGEFGPVNDTGSNSLLAYIIRGCAQINDTSFPVYVDIIDTNKRVSELETDSGAVLYIVAVLVFYSAGIIVMIVKYLRREKRELEEERILDDFFRSMPEYKREREQNRMNKVAIHAFHALTSFSENIVHDDCSSGDEAFSRKEETIQEEVGSKTATKHEVPTVEPKRHRLDLVEIQTPVDDFNVTLLDVDSDNLELRIEKETHL